MNKKTLLALFLVFFISLPAFAETLPYKEFIFKPSSLPSPHAASMAELPDGELFVVWYGATPGSKYAAIWGARKPAGSDKWTSPEVIYSTPGHSNKNPVLYFDENKKLWLFWAEERRVYKLVKDTIMVKTSADLGRTWDAPRKLGKLAWFLPKNHPIKLKEGPIVLPIYTDLHTSSAVAISKDGGLTWEGPRYIMFFFGLQPTIIQRSDSSLFALMRTGMPPRLAWQSTSRDLGYNWWGWGFSDVKNPGTALEMLKLKNGHVVLVSNDSKTDKTGITIALSYDEGRTWPRRRVIEFKAGTVSTYPSVIQTKDGLIHVVYSYVNRTAIAHFVTDEKWIEEGQGG
ncbi:MAG: exo-alpha-sialidase [Candidatus Omnitrophica bacterium]|nr:exo-alpha-sialidase [Candidatus Omnitrophota bacterium]